MNSVFSEEFLSSLPLDGGEKIVALCDQFRVWRKKISRDKGGYPQAYEKDALLAAGFVSNMCLSVYQKTYGTPGPEVEPTQVMDACGRVVNEVRELAWQDVSTRTRADEFAKIEAEAERLAESYASDGRVGVISQDKANEIRESIADLRVKIQENDGLAQDHKVRLIKKLSSLELELEKYLSTFDSCIGTCFEVAAVVKAHGEAAESLMKPAAKFIGLVVGAYYLAHGLPPPDPGGFFVNLLESGE